MPNGRLWLNVHVILRNSKAKIKWQGAHVIFMHLQGMPKQVQSLVQYFAQWLTGQSQFPNQCSGDGPRVMALAGLKDGSLRSGWKSKCLRG